MSEAHAISDGHHRSSARGGRVVLARSQGKPCSGNYEPRSHGASGVNATTRRVTAAASGAAAVASFEAPAAVFPVSGWESSTDGRWTAGQCALPGFKYGKIVSR